MADAIDFFCFFTSHFPNMAFFVDGNRCTKLSGSRLEYYLMLLLPHFLLSSQVSPLISCEITTIQLSNDEPYFISVRIIAYTGALRNVYLQWATECEGYYRNWTAILEVDTIFGAWQSKDKTQRESPGSRR